MQRSNPEEFQEQKSPCQHPTGVDIPYRIACSSSPMRRRTSWCVAIWSRPQLAVQKRLGSLVTTLTCSPCSSAGHGGRLSGRTSSWRSGTARCLTYTQQWTRWGTSVAGCPACNPVRLWYPFNTTTARARSPLWRYWWTMTSMACKMS